MKQLLLFLFCSIVANASQSQTGKEPVKLTDLLKIKTVAGITITKDGTKAAFTVTAIEPEENSKLDYKYITQIFSVFTNGNEPPVQLTYAKEGAAQPAWTPDGKQLAFVRTVDSKPQIFLLGMSGENRFS